MPQITPNPSIWILAKGRVCLRVAILVLLGTLFLAGRANAAAAVAETAPEASASTEPVVSAPEASASTEPVVEPEASAPTTPVVEPEASASTEPVVEPEASAPTTPVVEPEASAPTTPVVEPEASAPTTPVVEPEPEASPPVEPSKEAKEVPDVKPTKEAAEVSAGKPVPEQGAESLSLSPSAASQSAATTDNPSDSVAAEASGVMVAPVIASILLTPKELPTTSASASALARTIAAQRDEDFSRELGGLGTSSMNTYTVGFDSPSLISAAFVEDLAMGTAARAGAPAGGRSGVPPGGSSPIGPPPGSTPNGSFGGAAGGGAGTALSGFPTVAGHLLLGVPLAMHRLRLSFQPWLTAFFVLIPERPG